VSELDRRSDFLRAMKDTARSRFKAHKRLSDLDRKLTRIVSLSTAYIIILTITPYIIKGPTYVSDVLNFSTIFLSIIVLVGSLLQYSGQYALSAEQMHRSALEINEVRRNVQYNILDTTTSLDEWTAAYNLVLQKYSINHTDMDYHAAVVESHKDYPWVDEGQLTAYKKEIAWYNFRTDFMFWAVSLFSLGLLLFAYLNRSTT
jgi:hypothetical protein